MTRTRINYRQLAGLCAVVALTLALATAFTGSPSAANARTGAEPDLRNDLGSEVRALEDYADDLAAFNIECAQLNNKSQVRGSEVDPLERKADELKRRLSGVQNTIREVIRKLKAANAWDDLDQKLLASITDSRERTIFQQSSFKRDLEDAAANLGSRASDISNPINILRRKLTSQTFSPYDRSNSVVRVAYNSAAPEPMAFVSVACSIQRARHGLVRRLGGSLTAESNDILSCTCNPGQTNGIGTGRKCSEVLAR